MQLSSLLLVSLTVLIFACAKSETKTISRKKQRISPDQISLVLANQSITCSDPDFCPEGIARMFAINFEDINNSSTCSAFLVASDLVMTNSHCVYSKKMSLERICSGLYFVFPYNGFSYTAQCSKIIWRNHKQIGRPYYRTGDNDFALIKLDQNIPLGPLKLLNDVPKLGTKVFPLVVDQLGGLKARITKLECRIEKIIPKYGLLQLANCPVISGNSGSPVVDENFRVLGIIFASSDNKIRMPTDEINLRVKSKTKGYAFSIEHVQKTIGHFL